LLSSGRKTAEEISDGMSIGPGTVRGVGEQRAGSGPAGVTEGATT
jgi:hypothetical protein